MPTPTETLQLLWESAAEQEIGVRVPTDQPVDLRRELYHYRKEFPSTELEKFAIFFPNLPDGAKEIWIIRKTTELPA